MTRWLLALFAGIALLLTLDIADDLHDGAATAHVVVEAAVVALAAIGASLLLVELARLRRAAREMGDALTRSRDDAAATRAEADRLREDAARWRADAHSLLAGLGEAIERQLLAWDLTAAEREVALLLLKGLSHKEAADVRAVSERTLRQQALAIYRKAGVAGRAELSAFFLEDLLLPVASTQVSRASSDATTPGPSSASGSPPRS